MDQILPEDLQAEVAKLVEDYRDQCLWFLDPHYVPTTPEEILRVLDLIERYGDRSSFLRAEKLKQCLQHRSSAKS